ncbi:spore germination protein [Brevibacillus choshinensis]|uniref:spore germination protein n=1 Tax=Brevibacillus choshinensis TaxID=54911 RepID=UPI002E2055C3|nr:spore germination protein [Brevibacillus choshinensis]MED4754287.1 spore germination protein [Brevibacillus choshinensis]
MDQEMAHRWLSNTGDLVVEHIDELNGRVRLYYLSTMADASVVYNELIPKLRMLPLETVGIVDVEKQLGVASSNRVYEVQEAVSRIIHNCIYVHVEDAAYGLAIPSDGTAGRNIQAPEMESVVMGPQVAFVEELNVNLCIIRKYMPTTHLFHERLAVGKEIPIDISILYLENIVDPENVNTVRQRIQELNVDSHLDSSILAQYIADNERSLFPTLQQTERPDRVVHGLRQGQVAILVEGSPFVLLGPTTLLQFFQSPDDYYLRWVLATFNRAMRMFAMILSLLLTPVYVAALTYHYEMIPADLLLSLAQSRSRVPFPPLWEAFLMEIIIELLREAGARLPTKVGQTIGIVGGIVIGQAIVQAGFTSNILIIIVALGALSSFIAPSYMIGSTIRVIRFPMILLAGLLGAMGIVAGFSFLASHLLRQTSLGRPYMYPLYPVRFEDWKDGFIRAPLSSLWLRFKFFNPQQKKRFNREQAQMKKDIDE